MKFSIATYQRKPITDLQRKQAEESCERVRLATTPYKGRGIYHELTKEEKEAQEAYIKLHSLPF